MAGIKVNIVGHLDPRAFAELRRELEKVERSARDTSSRAGSAFSGLGKKIAGVGRAVGRVAKTAAVGLAGMGVAAAAGIGVAVNAASDLEESASKVSVVFGDQAGEIRQWARNAAEALGQSEQEALEAAGTFGNLFRAMGIGSNASAQMSKDIIQLSSDLASFNNANPEEVLLALRSGLVGETEPLRRFGVNLSAARIEAKALEMGLASSKEELTAGAKAQAAFAAIMEDTTLAQGDFARTSDGLANRQRILSARFKDLQARIGSAFLPIVLKLAEVVGDHVLPAFGEVAGGINAFINAFRAGDGDITSSGLPGFLERLGLAARDVVDDVRKHWPEIKATITQVLRAVSTAVVAVVGAVRQHWPEIQRIISQVINTVRTIIAGAVSVITTLWRNFGNNILEYAQRVWGPIQQAISGALETIRGVIQTITALIRGDWSEVWNGLKKIVTGAWNTIQGVVKVALEQIRLILGIALEILGSMAKGAWEGIKNGAKSAFNGLINFIRELPGRILALHGAVGRAALEMGKAFIKKLIEGIGNAGEFVGDIGKDIVNAAIDFLNTQVIDRINDALEVKIKGPGFLPDIDLDPPDIPHVPRLAEGGEAVRRGLALVGEEGPELLELPRAARVIPLDRARDAGSGDHRSYTFEIYEASRPKAVADAIAWQLLVTGA